MFAAITAAITALGPLLLQLGTWLFNKFFVQPAQAMAAFVSAVRSHENDGAETVSDMDSSDQQIADLKASTNPDATLEKKP